MDSAGVLQGSEIGFSQSGIRATGRASAPSLLEAAGIDAMIVTGPENIFYLTGQQTPGYYTFQALVLPVDGEPAFVVRQLEYFNFIANTFIAGCAGLSGRRSAGEFPGQRASSRAAGLQAYRHRQARLVPARSRPMKPCAINSAKSADGARHHRTDSRIVKSARRTREDRNGRELCRYRHACRTGRGQGRRERERSGRGHDGTAIAAGSEYVGMEPLVSVGRRSGVPHGTWRRSKIAANDPVFLEMAACHDRYHAALMRCAWLGSAPQIAIDMEQTCQDGLQAAMEAIQSGSPAQHRIWPARR